MSKPVLQLVQEINPNTQEWRLIAAAVRTRLAERVERLQDRNLTHDQTQVIRGEIIALREVLSLGDQPAFGPTPKADTSYL